MKKVSADKLKVGRSQGREISMTTNKQTLREAAEKATCGLWSLEYGEDSFDGDDALIHREVVGYLPICRIEGAHPESGFDADFQQEQQANAEFIATANPATVLALLDELEPMALAHLNLNILCDVYRLAYEEARHDGLVNWEAAASLAEENAELKRKLEAAERRIAELEAREVALPDYTKLYKGPFAMEVEHQVKQALAAAGIIIASATDKWE